jgi:GNAT superfamily N-acetyltransferase
MKKQRVESYGIKFSIVEYGKEVARTYLYVMKNDLHEEPFGLMEDVFVHEDYRQKGYGEQLVRGIIDEARERGCYKLICTSSKTWIQEWYKRLGFAERGKELRIDF